MSDFTVDDNTKFIAESIFSKPPGQKNSINLSLDEETSDIAKEDGVEPFIFNILTIITMYGVEMLFGHRNILKLTNVQIGLIKEYTRSYGYNLLINIEEKFGKKLLIINFERNEFIY